MAGRIPREFIEDLLQRVDLVTLIGARVALKKAGREFHACCPFHQEKTPSFTVSPSKQFYHCFGCGAHGNAIDFIMGYERLEFPEAVEELARSEGLEIPADPQRQQQGRHQTPLLEILQTANLFFRDQLTRGQQAARARAYLQQRQITDASAAHFSLGYAPNGWHQLHEHLTRCGFSRDLQIDAGLISNKNDRLYDRFRDRITFAIHNPRGQVVGFGARSLGEQQPKYLNSPETEVFHKGRILYGLHHARQHLRRDRPLFIVEGYMDVISLQQQGIDGCVATLGTATSAEHLQLALRYTDQLVFCFDGDRAGREAAWKALLTTLPMASDGRTLRFLFLPDQEDPDSLVRERGSAEFLRLAEQADTLAEFLIEQLRGHHDTRSIEGRAALVKEARPLVDQLPAGVYRNLISEQLQRITQLPRQQLGLHQPAPAVSPRRSPTSSDARATPVRTALAILSQHPDMMTELADVAGDWRNLQAPGIALLRQLVELLELKPHLNTATILEHWRDDDAGRHLQALIQFDFGIAEQGLRAELRGAIEKLNEQARRVETESLLLRSSPRELNPEERDKLLKLLQRKSGD